MVFGDSGRLRRIKRRAPKDNEDHEGKVNDNIKKGELFCKDQSGRNGNFNSALRLLSAALSVQNEIIKSQIIWQHR